MALENDMTLFQANLKGSLSMYFAHGYVFFFCWIIFALVQIATARYMRDKWETNMVLHTAFGSLISFATMFWGFWAINSKSGFSANTYASKPVQIGVRNAAGNRKYLHSFSAMAVPLMAVPLVVTGFIAYFRRWQAGSGATLLMRLRDLHKYLSWLFIFVSVYGVASGINSYNSSRMQYPYFWVVTPIFFFVPWACMEIRHQMFLREHIQFVRPLTTITEEEFYTITRKGKRHLLLLDDLVLDATDYAPYHPGGKFIIERTRGTDISKFFYGGYNLEPADNGENYNHTNYGRIACNSLIIGKLNRGTDISMVRITAECDASEDKLIKTFKFESIPNKGLSEQIMRQYPIDGTGKHYLIQEVNNGKYIGNIRHYTVSNVLAEDQYTDMCRALESHVSVAKGKQEKIIRIDQSLY